MDVGKLVPVDSVLTIFATVIGKARDYTIELRRLFFHLYVDDCLMVISLFNLPKQVSRKEPLKCSFDEFELTPIHPIFGDDTAQSWTKDRLAIQAVAADHTRLTLSSGTRGGKPTVKRFYEGRPTAQQLFDSQVSNGGLVITLNEEGFDHYISKFPTDIDDPTILVMSH